MEVKWKDKLIWKKNMIKLLSKKTMSFTCKWMIVAKKHYGI